MICYCRVFIAHEIQNETNKINYQNIKQINIVGTNNAHKQQFYTKSTKKGIYNTLPI